MRSTLRELLLQEITRLEVVDSHEHIPPEKVRLDTDVDVFTLFSVYTPLDLLNAGMRPEQLQSLRDHDIPLTLRWRTFAPFWERMRFTSYARAVLLAVHEFHGFDDINDSTYEDISGAMKRANKPGLYENVLRKACNIRTCLTWCNTTDLGTDLLTPVMHLLYNGDDPDTPETVFQQPAGEGVNIRRLDDLVGYQEQYILRMKARGVVGLKMISIPYGEPDRGEADACFHKLKSGEAISPSTTPAHYFPPHYSNPLRDYLLDRAIAIAGEQDLTVAIHTGYWQDFRRLDPLNAIPVLYRHPGVRFDIFHLGYPWVRETLMLGKGFPNVWLNFCWTHIISERCAAEALNEAMDLLPVNKILGFGGDYNLPVEKVYGHLAMARANIAKVLAARVEEKRMKEDDVLTTARMWLFENAKDLYRLKL